MNTNILEPGTESSAPELEEEISSETASAPAIPDQGERQGPDVPVPAESPAPMRSNAPQKSAGHHTATFRVLIVDDEMAVRAMACAIVKAMGYEATAVGSGEEAVETYREFFGRNEAFEVVVMDLALPGGMSGLETTDELQRIDEGVKVIASSGYLQQNARSAAIERGFAGILPKPYSAERLQTELRWIARGTGR